MRFWTLTKEILAGLGFAVLLLVILLVHYGMTSDVPPFRYIGY